MRLSHSPDLMLLGRYLVGDATPEERKLVQQWAADHPDEYRAFLAIQTAVTDPYGDVPRYNEESRIAAVVDYSFRVASRNRREASVSISQFQKERESWRTVWHSVKTPWSAVGLVTAALVIALFGQFSRQRHIKAETSAVQFSSYTTANGERATVTLSDGSTVLLNVGSRLDVPMDYGQRNRTLRLQGEALFTVVPQSSTPFIVEAGPSVTRVLGTQFSIRHYAADTAAVIAVREGKVAVQSHVLTAEQQIAVSARHVGRVQPVRPTQFKFESGILVLDSVPLPIAIHELNRWYDANVVLGDPVLARRTINGDFTAGSLTDLTAILERTFQIRVLRDGRTLTLLPNT